MQKTDSCSYHSAKNVSNLSGYDGRNDPCGAVPHGQVTPFRDILDLRSCLPVDRILATSASDRDSNDLNNVHGIDLRMTQKYFAACCIFPRQEEELAEATEVVSWPPDEEEDQMSEEQFIAQVKQEMETAPFLGRLFLLGGKGRKQVLAGLRTYLAERKIEPVELSLLDADVDVDFDVDPNERGDVVSVGYVPTLFLLRDAEQETIASFRDFCLDVLGGLEQAD